MEQYLALSRENQALGVVKPEIRGNVNFEIKSQFMRELREETFSRNKNEDSHDHVDRVLNIVRAVNTWDLLKKAFIQMYCPPSKTAKRLEDIHNFKQESDESLYQAWERYNDLLYKYPTHDINSHQKVNIFYKGLNTMNRQLLDSQGPIPGMTPTQAMTAIQTMAYHSQKWHDGTSSRSISSSSNTDGLVAIVSKLDNLGRDMKKLKENVHAIQVGCQICEGPHLDKECPLNEEVNHLEEVKYGEFGHSAPFNGSNGAKFRVGPPGYYTRTDNRPPYGEKRPSLEELMNKHQEELSQRSADMKEWLGQSLELQAHLLENAKWLIMITRRNIDLSCASVNVMPRNTFEYLRLANLRNNNLLVEMADMTKKAPLRVNNARVSYDMEKKDHNFTTPIEEIFMIKSDLENRPQSPNCSDNQSRNLPDREWTLIKVGHTDISEPVKKALLKLWLIDCFQDESGIVKDPLSRSFYDYKWVFDLEIDQLTDEYELGIGKKDICVIRYGNTVKMSIEIIHINGMTTDLKKKNVMKWK
ncbi:hypothetical protein Tco_0670870 [Tanacetum coccineum]